MNKVITINRRFEIVDRTIGKKVAEKQKHH